MSHPFNVVVRRFADFMGTSEYERKRREMVALEESLAISGVSLRHDFARVWEPAHVLLQLERMQAAGRTSGGVLEFGGGNSIVGYALATAGVRTAVLDVDPAVHEELRRGAEQAGLSGLLSSSLYNGQERWPFPDNAFSCVVAVSVFEGLTSWGRKLFWQEARRVLTEGGTLLLTYDYGHGARAVSDPVVAVSEIAALADAEGFALVGDLPEPPSAAELAESGAVKLPVSTMDGHDLRIVQYSFGALQLAKTSSGTAATEVGFSLTEEIADLGRTVTGELPAALAGLGRERRGNVLLADPDGGMGWHVRLAEAGAEVVAHPMTGPWFEGFDSVAILTKGDLTSLLECRSDMWELHYRGRLELRGDTSLIMRVVGAWQDHRTGQAGASAP